MKSQIPTILAIFILIGTLIAILVIKNQVQTLKSNASGTYAPQNLKITNIKDTSFTVSWTTDIPTISFIEYNSNQGQKRTDPSSLSVVHYIVVQNLNPNTNYTFRINSGGSFFDNSGSQWTVETQSSVENTSGEIVSGQIVNSDNLPAKNTLVYIDIPGNITFSALTSLSGNWIISLPPLADTTILQITVEGQSSLASTAKIDLKSANPVPVITLGKSFDFTNNQNTQASSSALPKVQITLP